MKHSKPTPVLRRRFDLDRRGVPLLVWVLGLILVATFVEVWQATRVSEITLQIDRAEKALSQAEARQSYVESQLAATRTRPALAALARRIGMKPAEPTQTVIVPAAYLAGTELPEGGGKTLVAVARRVGEVLVPSAWARSRR